MRTLGDNLLGCFRLRSLSGAHMRLGRICHVSNNLLVQIGLLSATAPLPLSWADEERFCTCGEETCYDCPT